MVRHTRIKPWFTLPIPLGNAIQISGLLGGILLARHAAKLGRHATSWLYTGRLLAYFCSTPFRILRSVGSAGYALRATGCMARRIGICTRQECGGYLHTCRS
jgi:hypothetical protein